MKFCRFHLDNEIRLGACLNDTVIDLVAAGGDQRIYRNMITLIAAGDSQLSTTQQLIENASHSAQFPLSTLVLAAPIIPSTVLCSGSNYRSHNAEKANTPISGKEPEFFVKTADCVIGPDQDIVCDPRLTKKLDCETELAIVIGNAGRHIPVTNAMNHIFGYTVANDVTARDLQVRSTPTGHTWYELGRGKAFDTSLPLGPVIVAADNLPDPQNLTLRTRINGSLRQQASTSEMIWSCAELVHFFSVNFTLKPGMVILTGTPAGTAWSVDAELGGSWTPAPGLSAATRYCLPGDVVESEIVEIGILKNKVVAAAS